jgi:hypothetical protein
VLNPQRVIADIDAVFLQFPDIAEDTELKGYVIEHGTDFKMLVEFCLDQMREAETLKDAVDLRRSVLFERSTRLLRKVDAMRVLIQKIMEHAQVSKWTLPEATLSLNQRPVQVVIIEEKDIPDDFCRFKREPDKTALKKALLDGGSVPGCTLSNGGVSLTVRTK